MTHLEMIDKLADAQTALYRFEQNTSMLTGAQRLEVMRVHSEMGDVLHALSQEVSGE